MPKVKDVKKTVKESDKLLTIKENAPATEAAMIMSKNQVGCLLVLDENEKFIGVLSERDMLSRMLAKSLSADDIPVGNIMSADVVSCTKDTDIGKAEQLMDDNRIRHLPIIENGIPIGMISSRDIIAYLIHTNKAMKAAAEQLHILSARLRGLDMEDLYKMMLNEVPESFDADSAIMCFAKKGSKDLSVFRKGCTVDEKELAGPKEIIKLAQNSWTICGEICDACQKVGGSAPRVVIPLRISKQYSDDENGQVDLQGFLCMCQLNQHSAQSKELQLHKASLLQEILGLHITNAKLYENYQNARKESQIDPLTDISTKFLLDKMLKIEHARAVRYKHEFSIALINVDKLRQINDSADRKTGDIVLQKIVKIISDNMRKIDLIGRLAEDEFVILMPETKLSGAEILLSRLQEQAKSISVPKVKSVVTTSCGLSEWHGSADDTIENILERAKTSLQQAKQNGGNQMVAN